MKIIGLILLSLILPSMAAAQEASKSFMALFSYDHKIIPGWSPHSFALFYQLSSEGKVEDHFSLSWLPKSGPQEVSLFSGRVIGKNYSFKETFDFAIAHNKKVTLSGHYQIDEALFLAALARKKQLESGNVGYEVIRNQRTGENLVIHCVHAISDIISSKALMDTGWSYAEGANKKIISHFKQHLKDTKQAIPWVSIYGKTPEGLM